MMYNKRQRISVLCRFFFLPARKERGAFDKSAEKLLLSPARGRMCSFA